MNKASEPLPKAIIEKNRFTWMYWFVPVGALIMCGWFIYRDVISAGPTITLYFQDAEGVEPKNTLVKYRGANVGEVKSLELTKDRQQIKLTAQLTSSAASLARSGSVFWIVRPEFKIGSITGLRTIVSGEYIAVQPGNGSPTNIFLGSDKPPLTEDPRALQIVLRAPDLSSLQELSPIFYRGIKVGEVLYFQLGKEARDVVVHARIFGDYAPLVQANTKFWNAGGIDVHIGLFKGIQVSAESPATIISGGIQFATPPEPTSPATNGTLFVLFEKPEEKWKTWMPAIELNLPEHAAQTNSLPELKMK